MVDNSSHEVEVGSRAAQSWKHLLNLCYSDLDNNNILLLLVEVIVTWCRE